MPASNKAGASRGGARGRKSRQPRQKRNLIGTEEEIANREFETGMFLWNPEKTFPEFKQIKPTSVSGRSVTTAGFKDLSMKGVGKEVFKFTSGLGKPPK